MSSMVKLEKLAREYIKPSKSTPSHLNDFKLSLLDQLSPSVYLPIVFFYPGVPGTISSSRSQHLKNSLSDLLTRFYPFGGRIKDHVSIECDDSGVEFIDVEADTTMDRVMRNPDVHVIKRFLPVDIESTCGSMNQLVRVQFTTLECGGTAIGVCWNHKVTDGCTASTFMRGWSLAARGLPHELVYYSASSLFPPSTSALAHKPLKLDMDKTASRRFVFHGPHVTALKALAASLAVPKPTKVESVSSLIWKCATKASRAISQTHVTSVMSQSVNIRERTDPPLPMTTVGNLVGYYLSQMDQHHHDLGDLVVKQRQGKAEVANNYIKKLQGEGDDRIEAIRDLFKEAMSLLSRDDADFFKCMSVSADYIDFGWGKPEWSTVVSLGYKNTIVLSQTRDGHGIEAWVTLAHDVMGLFERDTELLKFAS